MKENTDPRKFDCDGESLQSWCQIQDSGAHQVIRKGRDQLWINEDFP